MSTDAGRAERVGRVLVVCTGNVCRSPYIERRLVRMLDGSGVEVVSAGTRAVVEAPIDDGSVVELTKRQTGTGSFAARQLTPLIIGEADLVLTAAREHRATVVQLNPKALRYCFTIGDFADLVDGLDLDEVTAGEAGAPPVAQVAAAAAARRGLVAPRTAVESDILDPVNQGPAQFARMADDIERLLPSVVRALEMPIRHRP